MSDHFDDDFFDGDLECPPCYRCNDRGWIVDCFDDICRGQGWCMHGDGNLPCPDCDRWEDGPPEEAFI